jgi:hypothetical protein
VGSLLKLTWCSFAFSISSVIFCCFLPIVHTVLFFGSFPSVFLYAFPFCGVGATQYHGWVFPSLLDLQQKLSTQARGYSGYIHSRELMISVGKL